MDRMRLSARLEAWLEQEVEAGRLRWWTSKSGELKRVRGTTLAALEPAHEDLVEGALDLPGLSTRLRKGEALSYRAWSIVADRLGQAGPLPTLAEVLATRRTYWAACDAAHDARRAARRHAETQNTRTPAPTTQDTPAARPVRQAEPYRAPRYAEGELVEAGTCWAPELSLMRQVRWLEAHAEMDAPRAPVGEPLARARWADDVASQGLGPRRIREMQQRAELAPPAWMDEAPAWGEEVMR